MDYKKYKKWVDRDYWSAEEAAILLCGIDPCMPYKESPKEISLMFTILSWNGSTDNIHEKINIFFVAERCILNDIHMDNELFNLIKTKFIRYCIPYGDEMKQKYPLLHKIFADSIRALLSESYDEIKDVLEEEILNERT